MAPNRLLISIITLTSTTTGANEGGAGPLHEVDEFGPGDAFQSPNADDSYHRQQQILQQQQQQQRPPARPPPLTPIRFGSLGPATPNNNNNAAQMQTLLRRDGLAAFPEGGGFGDGGGGGGDGEGETGAADGEVQILDAGHGDFWSSSSSADGGHDAAESRGDENAVVHGSALPKTEGLEAEIGGGQVVPFVNHEDEKVGRGNLHLTMGIEWK